MARAAPTRDPAERHLQCCCGIDRYKPSEVAVPLQEDFGMEENHNLPPMEFDEFVYRLNKNKNNSDNNEESVQIQDSSGRLDRPNQPCVDAEAAKKTAERCIRRVRKLRRDLLNAGLLHHAAQRFSGQDMTQVRVMAPFSRHEIQVGNLLGSGAFSSVYEVAAFCPESPEALWKKGGPINVFAQRSRENIMDTVHRPVRLTEDMDARHRKAMRGATATSYAVKHLRPSLTNEPLKFERAALDLVLEAQLLMCLDHRNIMALRGWSHEGVKGLLSGSNTSFFILVDRLPETLEDRIVQWRELIVKYRSKLKMPWGKQKMGTKLDELLGQRIEVVHDVAAALEYMHSLRIMNRDLKVTNVGFDGNGVLKLFDFGLSRLLPARKEHMEDCYLMSRVGTKYYMAPEVRKKLPYNESADVYSFGVVAWEILSLTSPRDVLRKFSSDQQQPPSHCPLPPCETWPNDIANALRACVAVVPDRRPTVGNVRYVLEEAMKDMNYQRKLDDALLKDKRPSLRMDVSQEDDENLAADEISYATSRDGVSTVADHDIVLGSQSVSGQSRESVPTKNSKQTAETRATAESSSGNMIF